ncbi:MAG: DUF3795 domain-containing protein [Kiritimatiellae bacterium]|nr:DUF3795 domain-containing protein [Kiritimatiellia bacterium]MDD5521681.1 DUF3795 domain-containing protein [Kiritimatiellia bacterium]
MKKSGVSRRQFLGTAGKTAVALTACRWMCGEVCAAKASDACVDAICGIYCGACPALMDSVNAKRSSEIKCLGCRSTKKMPGYAPKCEVRKCAKVKKVQSCGLCKSYPCDKIKPFFLSQPKYGLREKYLNMVRDKGLEWWLEEMKTRWACKKCSTPFGYGMKTCKKCGEKVYSDAEEFEEFKKEKAKG